MWDQLPVTIPLVLILAVVPGWAVATIVTPHWSWWERLVPSAPLSAGLTWLLARLATGLHLHHLQIAVVTVDALTVGAAVLRLRRRRRQPQRASGSAPRVAVIGLAAGVVTVAALVWGHHAEVAPLETDAVVHGTYATAVQRGGATNVTVPEPVDQTAWDRPRDAAEVLTAVVATASGAPAAGVQFLIALAAVLTLPLAVAMFALRVTNSPRAAAIASVLALGLPFPVWPIIFGELPYVIDSLLVVPLVVALHDSLSAPLLRRSAVMLAIATAAIWAIHGLEIFTAAIVGGPWLLASAFRQRREPGVPQRIAIALGAALVGAVIVTLLTRAPTIPVSQLPPGSAALPPRSDVAIAATPPSLSDEVVSTVYFITFLFSTPVTLGLAPIPLT